MKKKENEMTWGDMFRIIKDTWRGKIGAALIVIGAILTLSETITFVGFLIYAVIGVVLISSVKSAENTKKEKMIEKKREAVVESATKRIGDYLYVNEDKQTWCVPSADYKEYAFTDLLDFSVVQDENVISSASLLNTVAGGAVFGLAGALVGANKTKTSKTCSKLQVQMNVNSISHPVIRIDLLPYEVKRSDDRYKKALETMEEITGVLRVIKSRNQQ